MKNQREGKYWTTMILQPVKRDAYRCGLTEGQLTEFTNQFHALGDLQDPLSDKRIVQLRDPKFARGILRFKTREPYLLANLRGLVLQIKVESRSGVLALVGLFPRSAETYDKDIPERLAELAR